MYKEQEKVQQLAVYIPPLFLAKYTYIYIHMLDTGCHLFMHVQRTKDEIKKYSVGHCELAIMPLFFSTKIMIRQTKEEKLDKQINLVNLDHLDLFRKDVQNIFYFPLVIKHCWIAVIQGVPKNPKNY